MVEVGNRHQYHQSLITYNFQRTTININFKKVSGGIDFRYIILYITEHLFSLIDNSKSLRKSKEEKIHGFTGMSL